MSEDFNPASARLAAGVLFRDAAGRVLLVKPVYKQGWDLPGGYVEPGEAPKRAAAREVAEELGINVPIGRLLAVDWAPHPSEGDKLLFVFAGGTLDEAVIDSARLQESEIARLHFASDDELPDVLPERLLHRIRSVLAEPEDPYLEHGRAASD